MIKRNLFKKAAVVGLITVVGLSGSIKVYADELLMRAYHGEYVNPANVDANLYLYEHHGFSGLDSDEDCELDLEGYVTDNVEENEYSFRAYTGSGRSIGAGAEVPFLTKSVKSTYKVSSERAGADLPTMELDIYKDYDDVKYY